MSIAARAKALGSAALRVLRKAGLADVLVIGGGIALTTGLVQWFGWAVALVVVGALALVAGVGLALRESRKAAPR